MVNYVQGKCNVRVVVAVETSTNRSAVLFSPDIDLAAARLYRYYKARFQIEFLFRDAKQFTGLTDGQARFPCQYELASGDFCQTGSATRRL